MFIKKNSKITKAKYFSNYYQLSLLKTEFSSKWFIEVTQIKMQQINDYLRMKR